jgi:hypothetical protein
MSSPPTQKLSSPTNNLLQIINHRASSNTQQSFRGSLFRNRLENAKNLYKKDLLSHFGCVNAIEFDQKGEFLISGECKNIISTFCLFLGKTFLLNQYLN